MNEDRDEYTLSKANVHSGFEIHWLDSEMLYYIINRGIKAKK